MLYGYLKKHMIIVRSKRFGPSRSVIVHKHICWVREGSLAWEGLPVGSRACRWRGRPLRTGRGRGHLMGHYASRARPALAALALPVGRRRLLHSELAGRRWERGRPALDPVAEGPAAAAPISPTYAAASFFLEPARSWSGAAERNQRIRRKKAEGHFSNFACHPVGKLTAHLN